MAAGSCPRRTPPSRPETRCSWCSIRASRTRSPPSSARPRRPRVADHEVQYLLVGGGLAAANCARWLRESGADGTILLVGREPDPPYNRPPCSKGYMQGSEAREDAYFRPGDWWEEQSIELLTRTSVLRLDPAQREARLSNRQTVAFEQALLATGANVRVLHVEGGRLDGLHYLRTLGNVDSILADAEEAERVELGERGGIRCSAQLETSANGIYAAGDVCEYDSPIHRRPVRIEHWDVAFNHGKTAALNMLGKGQPHDVLPYFFSDLADWSSMEYVGPAYGWEEEVVRGSTDDGDFSIWYLQDGQVAAALSVGRAEDLEHARRLITERTDVSQRKAALGDVHSELGEL